MKPVPLAIPAPVCCVPPPFASVSVPKHREYVKPEKENRKQRKVWFGFTSIRNWHCSVADRSLALRCRNSVVRA